MHPSVEKMVKGFQPLTMKYPCFNCPNSLKGKHNTKCEGTCEAFAKYKDDEKFIVEMMLDARDELCIKCERYRQAHLGACSRQAQSMKNRRTMTNSKDK